LVFKRVVGVAAAQFHATKEMRVGGAEPLKRVVAIDFVVEFLLNELKTRALR
jgi:hypothetical protein